MLTQPGVRLKEMCSTAQIAQEGSEATLVSKDKSSGQTIEPSPIRKSFNKINLEIGIKF